MNIDFKTFTEYLTLFLKQIFKNIFIRLLTVMHSYLVNLFDFHSFLSLLHIYII